MIWNFQSKQKKPAGYTKRNGGQRIHRNKLNTWLTTGSVKQKESRKNRKQFAFTVEIFSNRNDRTQNSAATNAGYHITDATNYENRKQTNFLATSIHHAGCNYRLYHYRATNFHFTVNNN